MHIRMIETYPLFYRLPRPYGDANGTKSYRTCYLIKITTDTGIQGWGECVDWLPTLHKGFHERIIPFLTGKNIADRSHFTRTIKGWHPRAAAAISMALTEIIANSCGISVCELWGGKFRDQVPVYASFQSYSEEDNWQKRSLDAIQQAIDLGFNSFKVKIGGKSISEDQQHISSVQSLLQTKLSLALDANQSYDLTAAMQWKSKLETWPNLLWLEEPMDVKKVGDYALLRSRLPIPLAGGENIEAVADYIPLLSVQALDYVTPDPLHVSGIDCYIEALKLARNYGVRVSPHCYDGALSRLYAILAQACLEPWGKIGSDVIEPVEWDVMDNPFVNIIPVNPVGGEVRIPTGNGIGVDIDLDLLAHYRWDGTSYA